MDIKDVLSTLEKVDSRISKEENLKNETNESLNEIIQELTKIQKKLGICDSYPYNISPMSVPSVSTDFRTGIITDISYYTSDNHCGIAYSEKKKKKNKKNRKRNKNKKKNRQL